MTRRRQKGGHEEADVEDDGGRDCEKEPLLPTPATTLGCGIRLHAGRICRIFAIFVPTAEWAHIFANVVAALLVCVDF